MRLRRKLHGFLVHGLIDHSGDLHVTAEWHPAYTVFSFAFPEFEQGEPGIEEELKFLDPGLEQAGENKVTELVNDHEQGETQQELCGFDKYDHECCII